MGTSDLETKLLQQITAMREAVLYEIFLDLQKTYDALDRYIWIEILLVYGVGPRALQILRKYSVRITVIARTRGYYGPPFKVYRGVTQGYPMSTNSFNVAMEAFIRHWVTVVVVAVTEVTEVGVEGLGVSIKDPAAYFYSDNVIVASTQLERPHRVVDVLAGLLYWVSLRKNT